SEMFKATRKTCYQDVLPLPKLEEVADRVRKGRVLLIVSPDSIVPSEELRKFFDGLSQKNNLCVLTGDKTALGSVEKAARQLFAGQKRDDLEKKQQTYELGGIYSCRDSTRRLRVTARGSCREGQAARLATAALLVAMA